jgi:hypothetical protein
LNVFQSFLLRPIAFPNLSRNVWRLPDKQHKRLSNQISLHGFCWKSNTSFTGGQEARIGFVHNFLEYEPQSPEGWSSYYIQPVCSMMQTIWSNQVPLLHNLCLMMRCSKLKTPQDGGHSNRDQALNLICRGSNLMQSRRGHPGAPLPQYRLNGRTLENGKYLNARGMEGRWKMGNISTRGHSPRLYS